MSCLKGDLFVQGTFVADCVQKDLLQLTVYAYDFSWVELYAFMIPVLAFWSSIRYPQSTYIKKQFLKYVEIKKKTILKMKKS